MVYQCLHKEMFALGLLTSIIVYVWVGILWSFWEEWKGRNNIDKVIK
ncbi:hypothetical protein J4466_02910 [Candidatus Pacearchaeota archaeon]|nr:hypothetical protein [Candidatus Pacearchaeota archaeon]